MLENISFRKYKLNTTTTRMFKEQLCIMPSTIAVCDGFNVVTLLL